MFCEFGFAAVTLDGVDVHCNLSPSRIGNSKWRIVRWIMMARWLNVAVALMYFEASRGRRVS
jgi:hypothetical protein